MNISGWRHIDRFASASASSRFLSFSFSFSSFLAAAAACVKFDCTQTAEVSMYSVQEYEKKMQLYVHILLKYSSVP